MEQKELSGKVFIFIIFLMDKTVDQMNSRKNSFT